jgi:hypothetical protein
MMMTVLEMVFILLTAVVLYTYIGYGIVLWIMVKFKQIRNRLA